MFSGLKVYLQKRTTKSKLKRVLKLLYSGTTFNIDELINSLKPNDSIDTLEYYIIIGAATELDLPFTASNIEQIHEEEIEFINLFFDSKESKHLSIDITKSKANYALLRHNIFMRRIKQAYENENYSPEGLYYKHSITKGRPLSEKEEAQINVTSKEIKRLDTQVQEAKDKLDEHIKKTNK